MKKWLVNAGLLCLCVPAELSHFGLPNREYCHATETFW
jgi:hypothetical protein